MNKLPIHLNVKPKVATAAISIIIFGASISYATIKVHDAMAPERLPANESCLSLADHVKVTLETQQNQISAVLDSKPRPQVDLSAIKTAYADCKNTSKIYTVVAK